MSFLIDTDLLSLLERKRVPAKLAEWITANDEEIFLSVVSLAELEYGLRSAPAAHRAELVAWLAETRSRFISATEKVDEGVLECWKELIAGLTKRNQTMTCEDSLIAATARFHGHIVATANTKDFEAAGVPTFNPLE